MVVVVVVVELVAHVNERHVKIERPDVEYQCRWEGCPRRRRGFKARCVGVGWMGERGWWVWMGGSGGCSGCGGSTCQRTPEYQCS